MGRNRFVLRKTKRIEISDGDWLDIKEQLNIGEQLDVEGAGIEISQQPGDREATYRMSRPGDAAITRVTVWLADWSLRDIAGNRVTLSRDAVGRLDAKTFEEIRQAIDEHVKSTGVEDDDDEKGDGDSPRPN